MNWNTYFFELISVIKKKSKDPDTQIGCVIVGPAHEIRSTGYNSFPRGINDNVPKRWKRPEKYDWMAHAESNAIFNAARVGTPLEGCTIYIDIPPCNQCAIAIIQSGIHQIILNDKATADVQLRYSGMKLPAGHWFKKIHKSYQMLSEAGVLVSTFRLEESNG